MDWNAFQRLSPDMQVGHVRDWIAEHEGELVEQGVPLWMHLTKRRAWSALHDMLSHPERLRINAKDEEKRGWLHLAIYMAMPPPLARMGLDMLDHTWKDPDIYGRTPFEIFPTPLLAQAMAQRLWSEQPMKTHPFAQWADQAYKAGYDDVGRVWNFWASMDKSQ